jgi:hypothetical protein
VILSHRHRLIFIKTRKTGGTSVELALSEICGPDDVITPVSRPDERLRKGRKPQNYLVPMRERPWDWPIRLWRRRNDRDPALMRFWPHMNAREILARVGEEVFEGYLKVSVERNPWDREVSNYHWVFRAKPEAKPSFEAYVLDPAQPHAFRNVDKYAIGDRIVADTVLRHDRLAADFAALMERLGVAPAPVLPGAKASVRPADGRDYRAYYSAETRDAIATRYRREIEAFGFEF